MQRGAAVPCQSAKRHRGVKLLKLCFQMLIDKQECLQGAAKITVAFGDNFVDCRLVWSGIH